jgi:hypothetical protein
LNSVTCSATPNSSNTHNWLYNAATSGTFYKASTESWSSDASGIPSGWTVVDAVIDLSTVTSDTILPNGWTVTGTLAGNYKISIAHGAIVTLHNVDINGSGSLNGSFAGITCEGDATIILSGTNTVRGFDTYYSGIQAGRYSSEPNPATLIIQGTGSLTAIGGNYGAGIGSSCSSFNRCGNIVINGGTITATGGQRGAGIGSCFDNSSCGNITITNTVTRVTATKGDNATNSIGKGGSSGGSCGTVTIGSNVGAISTSPYTYQP